MSVNTIKVLNSNYYQQEDVLVNKSKWQVMINAPLIDIIVWCEYVRDSYLCMYPPRREMAIQKPASFPWPAYLITKINTTVYSE